MERQNSHHFSQLRKKSGVTLVEMMMMLLVVSLALTALFYTLTQSITFARDTEARVKAIALAREWVEAMYNIRNTNWLRFSSDRTRCWNVLDYDASCIGALPNAWIKKIEKGSYILYQQNWLWKLGIPENGAFNDSLDNFRQSAKSYQLWITPLGWYTGSGGVEGNVNANPLKYDSSKLCQNIGNSASTFTNCRSIFSREIKIDELYNDNPGNPEEVTKMDFSVNVFWFNESPKKVTLRAEITNWKARYEQ